MLELKDNALQRILPSSISGDATVKDIVQAISGRLAQLGEQAELVLILPRLKKLPEEIVDELAWQYHVDFYDVSADIAKSGSLYAKLLPVTVTKALPQRLKKSAQQPLIPRRCWNGMNMAASRIISKCAWCRSPSRTKRLWLIWSKLSTAPRTSGAGLTA